MSFVCDRGRPSKVKARPVVRSGTPPPLLLCNRKGRVFERGPCIGSGAYSKCYRLQSQSGRLSAVKTVSKRSLNTATHRRRFLRELSIQRSLSEYRHASVVIFEECFDDIDNVYVRLELCENGSLYDMILRRGRLSEIESRYMMVHIMSGLQFLHVQNILHGDLKPPNVLLGADMIPKLADFGLACNLDGATGQRHGWLGTPSFMAPEVAVPPHAHGISADVWSLGMTLYCMLLVETPYAALAARSLPTRARRLNTVIGHDFTHRSDISMEAGDLLNSIFVLAQRRPTVREMINHPWFKGKLVSRMPREALYMPVKLTPSTYESMMAIRRMVRSFEYAAWSLPRITIRDSESMWDIRLPQITAQAGRNELRPPAIDGCKNPAVVGTRAKFATVVRQSLEIGERIRDPYIN